MNLQPAPNEYSRQEQQQLRNELDRRDLNNHKKDKHLEIRPGMHIQMTDANGQAYSITVSTAGALVVTAL